MLALNSSRSLPRRLILLGISAFVFASCASKPQPQLISDNTGQESSLPWNEQQKWEQAGQYSAMAERLETR